MRTFTASLLFHLRSQQSVLDLTGDGNDESKIKEQLGAVVLFFKRISVHKNYFKRQLRAVALFPVKHISSLRNHAHKVFYQTMSTCYFKKVYDSFNVIKVLEVLLAIHTKLHYTLWGE